MTQEFGNVACHEPNYRQVAMFAEERSRWTDQLPSSSLSEGIGWLKTVPRQDAGRQRDVYAETCGRGILVVENQSC